MTDKELSELLKEDSHDFTRETQVKIENQKWHVGYEVKAANHFSRLTFYRRDNTGNFGDSVLVGAIIYPLVSSDKKTMFNLNRLLVI